MKIASLKIKNFKALKKVEMRNIPNFCVILGANGSGKTTLFGVFGFLKDALNKDIHTALAKQGGSKGFDEVRSRNSTGNIEIEIKFRAKDTAKSKNPLITYFVSIGKDEQGNVIVEKEVLNCRLGRSGQSSEFLNFSNGKGKAIISESLDLTAEKNIKREYQTLKSPAILAIKGLAQFAKFPAAVALGELIDSWHLSCIHVSKGRGGQEFDIAEHLSTSGDNLSLVIDYLAKKHPQQLQKIKEALKRRIPGIVDVETQRIETGEVLLKVKDPSFDEPFLVHHLSDGTIKMLAYLVLLYDPKPHPLLCVEGPENQMYPSLLDELAEEFSSYASRGAQVFVATHSPDFLNAVNAENVFCLIKKDGYTTIKPALEYDQVKKYMEKGDQMGHLWREGFFDGVDPS